MSKIYTVKATLHIHFLCKKKKRSRVTPLWKLKACQKHMPTKENYKLFQKVSSRSIRNDVRYERT